MRASASGCTSIRALIAPGAVRAVLRVTSSIGPCEAEAELRRVTADGTDAVRG